MKGPFYLPADMAEGDYIEIGSIGAYGRVMAGHFNGCGHYDVAEFADEPMLTAYGRTGEFLAEQISTASEQA
jgi:ornithine decarboxylase